MKNLQTGRLIVAPNQKRLDDNSFSTAPAEVVKVRSDDYYQDRA